MAICRIIETGATPEQYEQIRSKLGVDDASPPPGGQIHIAATGEDGKIRIIEVWNNREQAEQWGDKVRAVRQELGLGDGSPPPITYFEVQRVMSVQPEVVTGSKPIEGVGTAIP